MMDFGKKTPPISRTRIVFCVVAAVTVAGVLALQTFVLKKQWDKANRQEDAEALKISKKKDIPAISEKPANNPALTASLEQNILFTSNLRLKTHLWTEPIFLHEQPTEASACLRGLVVSTLGADDWAGGDPEAQGLGAVFLHVASAWAVAYFHGVQAVVPQRAINRLNAVFTGIHKLVKPLDQVIESRRNSGKYPCNAVNESMVHLVRPLHWEDWEGYGLRILSRGPLMLKSGNVYPAYIAPLIYELQTKLGMRHWLIKWANDRLHQIRSTLTRFSIEEEPWSFVAVHGLRRSVKGVEDEEGDVSISFYARAVASLRSQLFKELRGRRVLLAVVSFNHQWALHRLVPVLESSVKKSQAVSVAWAGAMTETYSYLEAEMMDLALMLMCNHSVASHGSLATTATLLNDGLHAFWARSPSNLTTAFSWLLPEWKMMY